MGRTRPLAPAASLARGSPPTPVVKSGRVRVRVRGLRGRCNVWCRRGILSISDTGLPVRRTGSLLQVTYNVRVPRKLKPVCPQCYYVSDRDFPNVQVRGAAVNPDRLLANPDDLQDRNNFKLLELDSRASANLRVQLSAFNIATIRTVTSSAELVILFEGV